MKASRVGGTSSRYHDTHARGYYLKVSSVQSRVHRATLKPYLSRRCCQWRRRRRRSAPISILLHLLTLHLSAPGPKSRSILSSIHLPTTLQEREETYSGSDNPADYWTSLFEGVFYLRQPQSLFHSKHAKNE